MTDLGAPGLLLMRRRRLNVKNTGRLRRDLPLLLLLGLLFGDFSSSKGEFLEVFLFLSGPCVCVCARARASEEEGGIGPVAGFAACACERARERVRGTERWIIR